MSKATINNELLALMEDYNLFMESSKTVDLPIVVSETKKNHPTSKYYEGDLAAAHPFGNTKIECEVKDRDYPCYSLQIRSDIIRKRVLLRFDEGDASHRNVVPGIPLEQQSVTTPHFHKYNGEGYFIAYKNEKLRSLTQTSLPLEEGFDCFSREANIDTAGHEIKIQTTEADGTVEMNFNETDPLEGINF